MLKAAIFDLDGTLLDSGEGITESLRYAERKLGLTPVPEEGLLRYVGMPIRPMLGMMYGVTGENADARIDTILEAYREHYRAIGHKKVTIFEGVPEMLEQLKKAGIKIAIATSKREQFSRANLTDMGLIQYFDALAFAKPDDSSINKVGIVKEAVDMLDLPPSECIMVGDKEFDIEGARGAGTQALGVTYGFGSTEEIESAKPDYIAQTAEKAGEIILKLKINN